MTLHEKAPPGVGQTGRQGAPGGTEELYGDCEALLSNRQPGYSADTGWMATFDGDTYDADLDRVRLGTQLHVVYQALRPGGWWSLTELADASGGSEAGVSARLRDLRKPRFGGHTIERRRHSGGRWLYRLVPKAAP